MSFNLGTALSTIAPTLATMLGGPLAGGAVSALLASFGIDSTGDQSKDISAITNVMKAGGMTPEIAASVRAADQAHAERISQQGIDLVKVNNDHKAAMAETYAKDTQDARKTFGQQQAVFWLGVVVLVSFAGVMAIVLIASYSVLVGGIVPKDPATVAAISGMVGAVVGYVAANAQQVVGYFFGSSATTGNAERLGSAVNNIGDRH